MEYPIMLRFEKCLFINLYISILWFIVTAVFLFVKISVLDHLTRYLALTVYLFLAVIEPLRLFFGFYGNLTKRVPELAGFLMMTVLMQLPLVSFFLFNSHLLNTPTEITVNVLLWTISIAEIGFDYFALKAASAYAKRVYLVYFKKESMTVSS